MSSDVSNSKNSFLTNLTNKISYTANKAVYEPEANDYAEKKSIYQIREDRKKGIQYDWFYIIEPHSGLDLFFGHHKIHNEFVLNFISEKSINVQIEFGDTHSQKMVAPGIMILVGSLIMMLISYLKIKNYNIEQPDENIS